MIRRSRAIGLAVGLLLVFVYITSRNSGSHPRDLRSIRSTDSETEAQLHAILKEPPGKWDPDEDEFIGQHHPPAVANPQIAKEQPNVLGKAGSDNIKKDEVAAAVDHGKPGTGAMPKQPGVPDAVKAAGQVPLRQPDSQEPEAYDPAQGNLELHSY